MDPSIIPVSRTYKNPVYPHSFPDPFVLKYRGEYFAYCTGHAPDGRVFKVLRSSDLVSWEPLGGAMQPLDSEAPFYWAPEVTYHNGLFYLYYSVGNEVNMELRVAISDRPDGGFVDSGSRLTLEEFAIDAHVFIDDDGQWYMFYATDFLAHTHIGTGTVVDRMTDPLTLAGDSLPVTRARYNWQVYDPNRKEKGGVRWHTVEGPFVLKRKGIYFEMFSGGNWQNVSYGVSFAVSDSVVSENEWEQFSDGTTTLPIMRTIPDKVIGPGHNSVVRGPNDRELYCIYHSWVDGERVMSIDRLDFTGGNEMVLHGPTFEPQPAPFKPIDVLSSSVVNESGSSKWVREDSALRAASDGNSEVRYEISWPYFRSVLSVEAPASGAFGIYLKVSQETIYRLEVDAENGVIRTDWPSSGPDREYALPYKVNAHSEHEFIIDVDSQTVSVTFDGIKIRSGDQLTSSPTAIGVFSNNGEIAITSWTITRGFEELFETGQFEKRGWDKYVNAAEREVESGCLLLCGSEGDQASVTKLVEPGEFELCVNFKIVELADDGDVKFGCGAAYSIALDNGYILRTGEIDFPMPQSFRLGSFCQFRVLSSGGRARIYLDNTFLGEISEVQAKLIDISAREARAEIEMVRYTLI